ncbi:PorP/SprF family type IX secretion system membrane protein [Flavobacteriaceae bacterium M23B6Z8]
MNRYHFFLFMLLSMLVNTIYSQQTPVFSEYNFNPFLINAAYAGAYENAEFTLANNGFINQFEGSPQTLSATGHAAFNEGKMGLGGGFISDKLGVTTTTQLFAAYSYKIFFDFQSNRPQWQLYNPGVLSFGITGGFIQYENNLLNLGIQGDPNFAQNLQTTVPAIGVGFMFNKGPLFAGISTPNILGDQFASNDELNITTPYYGYLGYYFFLNRFQDIVFKPNVLVKYESGAPWQADFNMSVSLIDKIEVGAGYRTNSSINFLAGLYLFENFRLVYSYNQSSQDNPLGNTHGIILSIRLGNGFSLRP